MHTFISHAKTCAAALLCVAMIGLGGCAKSGGKVYSSSEAQKAQTVQYGVIQQIAEVTIEDKPGVLGAAAGGTVGGVLGSTIGGGRGRILTTVGGAVAGAIMGALGEKQLKKQDAYEFTIALDNGQTVNVVQAADDTYKNGDRVRVIYGTGNKVRIVKQ